MAPSTPKKKRPIRSSTTKKRSVHDTPKKIRIKLRYEQGASQRQIEQEEHVPRRTVRDIIIDPNVRTARPQRKRKYKVSEEYVLALEQRMDNNYELASMTWDELIDHEQINYTSDTLRKAFQRAGLRKFDAAQKKVNPIYLYL